jgi:PAS domain S-box-containing protein
VCSAELETTLTSQLAQLEAALRDAEQQHTAAMAAAATERAERQAQFELELSQTAAARDEFKHRFNDADTALAASRRDHAAAASEVERLTAREAALTSQLGEAAEMRSTLEQQLTDRAAALRDAHEGASRDRLAAETKAAEREAEFERLIGHERAMRADVEGRLAQETAHREALDGEVAQMRTAAADAEQRYREETAALTARGRHQITQLESQFAKEREAQSERQARLLNDIQNLEAARGALDESLTALREESRLRAIDHQNERDALQRARSTAEAEIQRLAAELTEAMRSLEEARKNFQQTLDLVSSEHADSQAKLLASVEERDARIADVEKRLDDTERELRRQFQHAPLPVWRCTREGAFSDANQALAKLVGYRQPDELRHADFVKTVFESTDDLSWLIERCLATKAKESVETAWKRRSGEHMVVRLSAVECPPDLIEIAVEDVTNVRVLED